MIIQAGLQPIYPLKARHDINQQHSSESPIATQHQVQADKTASVFGQQVDRSQMHQISELRSRDQEVRAHELAHLAAAGGLSVGGASFEFTVGPDGQRYAVGGEVQIDTSGVPGDPEATLQKAIQIQQAALAPAQPSAQDRSVAMAAAAMAAEARTEIMSQKEVVTINNDNSEGDTQHIAARVNHAYNAVTQPDTQNTSTLIDLIA